MDTTPIIQFIDAEIARLEQAKILLNGHTHSGKAWQANRLTSYSHR